MQFPDRIDYKLAGDDIELPRMFKARQLFSRECLDDIEGTVKKEIAKLKLPDLNGKKIALTAGSRGVANLARILKAVADKLKTLGAKPFIVPGMGSHGGAVAEGQLEILTGYGITEKYCGIPILSSMDTVKIGRTASGFDVYCDKHAAEADYIFPVHRVKPHTGFKGEIESGICKMLVIGLGKHRGATAIHKRGLSVFAKLIPEAAQVFFDTGKVLAAAGVLENAYEETMIFEAMETGEIIEREKALLAKAKDTMAKLRMDAIDVLIIEEIGKDISGAGMDANITGKPPSGEPGFQTTPIRRIAVLGISELSHGNAIGIGCAHIVTVEVTKKIDLAATYTNGITSRVVEAARIPLVANSDREAIKIAIFCDMGIDQKNPKIVQIRNTLMLDDILMSEAYLSLVKEDKRFEILSDPVPMQFSAGGKLARPMR